MSIIDRYLKQKVINKIQELKYSSFGDVSLQFFHDKKKHQLILLTKDCVEDEQIVNNLAKWRDIHQKWFPAQFKVTGAGTKKWLQERVIETSDRLLFIIKSNNKYIGHVGLFRFNFKNMSCELDNIVRGEPLYPGIITAAILTMMDWGKKILGVKFYELQTSSDNDRALKLYTKLNFRELKREPLIQVKSKSKIEWVKAPKNYSKEIKRYNIFMQNKKISFAGPSITEKEIKYVVDGVKNGFYETFDLHIKRLERAVADYVGMKYALAGFCATHSLHLACLVCGFKKGDEVICTDFSWVATSYVITYTGATPIFVDIDPNTWCIDPKAIEKAITKKTKGIMLVHSFGYPANMDEIMRIAKKYNLKVIEDAAPALGSIYKNKKVGSFGDVNCFSFHGAKMAASGEGGMLLTNNKEYYEKAILLSNMGRTNRLANFWSDSLGYEYQMSNVTAALALAQVERIEELVKIKRQIFDWYYEGLKDVKELTVLKESDGTRSNYCYPAVLLKTNKISRNNLVKELSKYNIHARESFPRMSRFPIYSNLTRLPNPVATRVEKHGFNLPAAANLNKGDVDFVCKIIKKILHSK